MELTKLVEAAIRVDMLAARQWVADAERAHFQSEVPEPLGLDASMRAVAAALVGLFAWLTPAQAKMPRSRKVIEENCPPPLRRMGVFATENYLTIA